MTFWKTPEFQELQQAWYQRLADSGFQDAEILVRGELLLRQSAEHPYRDADELIRESKDDYYYLVSQKVQETQFPNDVDRIILTRHAEGLKQVQICRELEMLGMRRYKKTIRFRIRIYEMQWGLRTYTPRQLNRRVG